MIPMSLDWPWSAPAIGKQKHPLKGVAIGSCSVASCFASAVTIALLGLVAIPYPQTSAAARPLPLALPAAPSLVTSTAGAYGAAGSLFEPSVGRNDPPGRQYSSTAFGIHLPASGPSVLLAVEDTTKSSQVLPTTPPPAGAAHQQASTHKASSGTLGTPTYVVEQNKQTHPQRQRHRQQPQMTMSRVEAPKLTQEILMQQQQRQQAKEQQQQVHQVQQRAHQQQQAQAQQQQQQQHIPCKNGAHCQSLESLVPLTAYHRTLQQQWQAVTDEAATQSQPEQQQQQQMWGTGRSRSGRRNQSSGTSFATTLAAPVKISEVVAPDEAEPGP